MSSRILLVLLVVVGMAGLVRFAETSNGSGFRPQTRWFIPGPLGTDGRRQTTDGRRQTPDDRQVRISSALSRPPSALNAGSAVTASSAVRHPSSVVSGSSSGFLTRAFSGLRTPQEAEWGKRNGLTGSLNFSHNLARVFPTELYQTHPEFFPLVDGKRLDPPKGSGFWNPDIARPDVAVHAAHVARDHFIAHPDEISFALGVNDALIWGESRELLALARGARAEGQRGGGAEGRRKTGSALPNEVQPKTQNPEPRTSTGAAAGEAQMSRGTEGRRNTDSAERREQENFQRETQNSKPETGGNAAAAPPNLWFRHRPDYSDVVFTFMNRAAEELSRTHPQKYLGALAYYWCENVPSFPIHPQVVPFLTADRSQGYDASFREEEFRLQDMWGKLAGARSREQGAGTAKQLSVIGGQLSVKPDPASDLPVYVGGAERTTPDDRQPITNNPSSPPPPRRLGMYDYLDGAGFLIPRIHTRLIAENIRHAHRAGFTDYYGEASPNWGLEGPMSWLVTQLLQDPEQSRDALLDEYYTRYFREAAEPMQRFFAKCEELWMAQPGPPYWLKHYRNESQAILFPPHERGLLRLLLSEAEVLPRSRKVQQRVQLVSYTFRVTERMCELYETRDALSRALLNTQKRADAQMTRWSDGQRENGSAKPKDKRLEDRPSDHPGIRPSAVSFASDHPGIRPSAARAATLTDYLTTRREFIHELVTIRHEQPLALYPVNYPDFLRNNPAFAATVRLLDQASDDRLIMETLSRRSEIWIQAAVEYHRAKAAGRVRELLSAGSLEGPRKPGRRIAGLAYGVDIPAPWLSKLEPTQTHEAVLEERAARTGAAGLKMSGAVNSTMYQWAPITGGRTIVASVYARARISPSNASTLTLGWLDKNQRHVGTATVMRIPDGEWPGWILLQQGTKAPENAAWAGIAIQVQNQLPGDWVEFDDFSMVEVVQESVKR